MTSLEYRTLVDIDTGEVLSQVEIAKEFINNKVNINKNKIVGYKQVIKKDEFSTFIKDNCGAFNFINYNNELDKLQPNILFRFIYLTTYLDYNNKLMFGKGNNPYMKLKDLPEVFNLSYKESLKTKNVLLSKKILIVNKDKTLSVSDKFGFKGTIQRKYRGVSVRIFRESVRDLYLNTPAIRHKKAGLIFKILPLIHHKYNVLTFDVTATHGVDMNPITITQLSEILGYNKSNASRFAKEFFSIKVLNESIFGIFQHSFGKFITINPKLFYKGNDFENLKLLNTFFAISNNSKTEV